MLTLVNHDLAEVVTPAASPLGSDPASALRAISFATRPKSIVSAALTSDGRCLSNFSPQPRWQSGQQQA